MSPDTIDKLVVNVIAWIENTLQNHELFEVDAVYEEFSSIFYEILEPHCTKDRNYN